MAYDPAILADPEFAKLPQEHQNYIKANLAGAEPPADMVKRATGPATAPPVKPAANSASLIGPAATKHGVDPALVQAVMAQESGGNQAAVSPKGAIGAMQLMPGTASSLGVNPHDPAQNVDGGVKLLSQLMTKYKGDLPKALAAYNAGEGAVDRAGGVPNYPETQNYVKSILGKYVPSLNSLSASPAEAAAANNVLNPKPPASTTPPPEDLDMIGRWKKDLLDATRKNGNHGLATVGHYVIPGSFPEIAALAATGIAGPEAGIATKLAYPTIAAAITGLLTGEGALSGGASGLAAGVGGKIGEAVGQKLTGVGKGVYRVGKDFLVQSNERYGPAIGAAIEQSIPSLRLAGVRIRGAEDIHKLLETPASETIGKLMDKAETQIAKQVVAPIDMPVPSKLRTSQTTSKGRSGTTSERGASGEASTDVTSTRLKEDAAGVPLPKGTSRVQTEGTKESLNKTSAESTSATERNSSSLSKVLTLRDTQPMTAEAAIKQMHVYRRAAGKPDPDPEMQDLYHKSVQAITNAVGSVDRPLANHWSQLRTDYAKLIAFQDVFNKNGKVISSALPKFGDAGTGLNVGDLATLVHQNPKVFRNTPESFGPLYDALGGGGRAAKLPGNVDVKTMGGYMHLPGFPFSFHIGEGGFKHPGVELTPELSKAIEKFPALRNALGNRMTNVLAGGVPKYGTARAAQGLTSEEK